MDKVVISNVQGVLVATAHKGRVRKGFLLCDSGASHELQVLRKGQPLPEGCVLSELGLAVGQFKGEVYMSPDGVVYVYSDDPMQPLFPITAYIKALGLKMLVADGFASIQLPNGSILNLTVDVEDPSTSPTSRQSSSGR